MLSERMDEVGLRARACGLERAQLLQLRSLLAERGRAAWSVGDLLVAAFGPPGPAVVHDGSTRRLEVLSEHLGCSASWLAASRATAAAFPERERRPSVAWAVHRALAARPDRYALLDRFIRDCDRRKAVPSARLLTAFLDALDARRARRAAPTGRPRQDPIVKLERLALALDHDDLARLVERLQTALTATVAA